VKRTGELGRSSSNIGRGAAGIGDLSEPIGIWKTVEMYVVVERVTCKGREKGEEMAMSEPIWGGGL
jgi:hypothetical protein